MTKCNATEIQESLPDLIHAGITGAEAARIEAHVAGCADCREELRVLRAVYSAAVFQPVIDTQRIVRAIPPYAGVPVTERPAIPARPRAYAWLAAAGLSIVLGTLVIRSSGDDAERNVAGIAGSSPVAQAEPAASPTPAETSPIVRGEDPVVVARSDPLPAAFALAGGLDDLSDGSLVALMTDMENFDGLPASEPEPVLTVEADSTDPLR